MRRSLGTAVFSGMLGVTLFGVLLTPVFFYVIEGLGDLSFFRLKQLRWRVRFCSAPARGLIAGWLAWHLWLAHFRPAIGGGLAVGLLTALLVHRVRRRPGA